ncbi:MAG: hydrolase [Chloroflexi bacterium]|nr:MAG: hydrolase [Chloroflexota bacterium]
MVQGVIFDVDGTLVLSNDQHAQAWVDALAEFGYDVPFERVRPLIGMGGDKLMPEVVPGLNDEESPGKEIAKRRKEIFKERYLRTLTPANGSRQLLEHLKNAGVKIVIASSATSEELSSLLQAAGVEELVEDATTSSDANESKPAPDIVGVALDKLKLQPEQTIMIGDTPYDIESAKGCGVGVVGVRCGGFSDDQLAGAVAIYDDPADILAHVKDSPLA